METELDTPPEAGAIDDGSGTIVRTFAADLTAGDGRTIDVRVVPYGERITHNDGLGGLPKGMPYTEEWAPGAFAGQERAANRVLVNFEHQEGIGGIVGHGTALIERTDGLYGSFKLHETPDGDKALMLVREGVLGGVSLEAKARRSIRTAGGVIQRVKAHLVGVALCRAPAYPGSVVLALREQAELIDEDLLPVSPDPQLIERCRQLGIKIPQRFEAHPDVTDTPAETGTSEDGTRQTQTNPS
jgi:HK97 family phage prohead protease